MRLRNVSGGTFTEEIGGSLRHFGDGEVLEVSEDRARALLGITPKIVEPVTEETQAPVSKPAKSGKAAKADK